MSREPQYKQRGYLLPENLDPDKTCICLEIPCDPNHALAFLGQLDMLGYWWTWERDELKRGTEAARIWREIAEQAREQVNKTGIFDMGCGCGDEQRIERQYIGEDGRLHVIYEDGTEEIRDDLDPRFSSPTLPAPTGGSTSENKCVAANSIVTLLREMQQAEYQALLDGTNLLQTIVNTIAAIIAVVIAAPVVLIPAIIGILIVALANAIADFLPEAFDNEFTEDTWQDLLCILYCEMSDDTSFTPEQWATVKSRVVAEIGGYAGITWLHDTINLFGAAGLTNAARLGYGGSRDCSECDCEPPNCGNAWVVTEGTLVSYTETSITVQSALSGSQQVATIDRRVGAGGDGLCCFCTGATLGFPTVSYFTIKCDGSSGIFDPANLCIAACAAINNAGVPFTVTWNFSGECP